MAQQPAFETLFGGGTANVDFSRGDYHEGTYLQLPNPGADLEHTAMRLTRLANVVEEGRSVAVATNYAGAVTASRDPVELAEKAMTPTEMSMFRAINRGLIPPAFDMGVDRAETSNGRGAEARYAARARAMDQIYKRTGHTAENVASFQRKYEYAIPLLTAFVKVEAAGNMLCGGVREITGDEMAEIQVIGKAIAIAANNVNELQAYLGRCTRAINMAKNTLQAREHAIKRKIPSYKPKQSAGTKERELMGKAPLSGQVNYERHTTGGRQTRSNLFAGMGQPVQGPTGNPPPPAGPSEKALGKRKAPGDGPTVSAPDDGIVDTLAGMDA